VQNLQEVKRRIPVGYSTNKEDVALVLPVGMVLIRPIFSVKEYINIVEIPITSSIRNNTVF
jgi:hypothetical protein